MLGKVYAKPADLSTEKAKNFPGKTGCSLVAVTVAAIMVEILEMRIRSHLELQSIKESLAITLILCTLKEIL